MPEFPRPCLCLVDGYALIYRAFFAMISRPLTTSRGENTSVAWGIANFLLRMVEEYRPEYVAWVHDAGTSFRTEVFPDYKATREKLDEELQDTFDSSVERVEELLDAFRITLVSVEGYEADDVIGTLAAHATAAGIHTVIVSGDKDFYQLLSPSVSLLNPGRGGPAAVQEELVTPSKAPDRLGVPPERVVDYLALVGDSSDNVPGVRGVGDKTARKLIAEYGDLDAILEHAAEVKGKRAREALLAEAENARLSRDLVTIQCDVPVDVEMDALAAREPDREQVRQLFGELEFHTLAERLGSGAVAAAVPEEAATTVVPALEDLPAILNAVREAGVVALRVVGSDPDVQRADPAGLALALPDGRAWFLPLAPVPALAPDLMEARAHRSWPPLTDPRLSDLVAWLEDESRPKVGHDVKHDVLVLRRAEVILRGTELDTMIASFLLDPGKRSHALEVLGVEHLGVTLRSLDDLLGKGKTRRSLPDVPIDEVAAQAGPAAALVLRLHERFVPALEETGLDRLLHDIEMPLIDVLADMEWYGIKLDTDRLAELSRQYTAEARNLEAAIHEAAGVDFNINSNPQLRHVLFEKLQLPVVKKTKTGPSTDAEVLAVLAGNGFEVPRLLLEYRELTKLISTYVDALPRAVNPRTGRIHTTFHQTGAATGRLSSSDPNLQNIPVRTARGGEIRRCFIPADGCVFVVADYSQVELRLLAHLSGDPAFTAAFQRGGDIHCETAAIIFDVPLAEVTPEMRSRAKTINFATIYGQGPFALANQLEISREEAKAFIDTYFERFAGVRAFLDGCIERARETGYVETLFGRRRYIREIHDRNFNVRSFGERTAMNSPIQGSAADLIKIAMRSVYDALGADHPGAALLLQVHDELVVEVPRAEATAVARIVQEKMEGAAQLNIPLVVDVGTGPNWLDAKS